MPGEMAKYPEKLGKKQKMRAGRGEISGKITGCNLAATGLYY